MKDTLERLQIGSVEVVRLLELLEFHHSEIPDEVAVYDMVVWVAGVLNDLTAQIPQQIKSRNQTD